MLPDPRHMPLCSHRRVTAQSSQTLSPLKTWVKSTAWPVTPSLCLLSLGPRYTQDHSHSVPVSLPAPGPWALAWPLPAPHQLHEPSALSQPPPTQPHLHRGHLPPLTWTTPAHRPGHPLRPSTQLCSPYCVSLFAASRAKRLKLRLPGTGAALKRWSQGPSLNPPPRRTPRGWPG